MATVAELNAHLAGLAAPLQHLRQANGRLVSDKRQARHAEVAGKLREMDAARTKARLAAVTAGKPDPGVMPVMPTQ